mgnify:CR=1 FL=1
MIKTVKELINNVNINTFIDNDDSLNIEVYSYDRDLAEHPEYSNMLFKSIVHLKKDLKEYFNRDTFILSIDNYSIDGLYESNSGLIGEQSVLTCIY